MAKVILIVEDDPKSRTLTRDILQTFGYTTIEATDGEQGVVLAKSKKPDLILMDIMMPVLDGYTACHIIKTDEATKEIPVVMLTSVGLELNKEFAKILSADGYISKPFTPQELLDVVNQFVLTS